MSNQAIYTLEKESEIWRDEDKILLSVTIEYPLLATKSRASARINKYYAKRNKRFIELCKRTILPKVTAEPGASTVTAELRCKVSYYDDNRISIISDSVFSRYVEATRHGDIWSLNTGTPESLAALFPTHNHPKRELRNYISSELQRKTERFIGNYYPDAVKRAERHFSSKNIFISSGGNPVIFFQQNTIAPRGEGFVQFEFTDTTI